jgi:hypothetical protein
MVEFWPSKPAVRVRSPSPAPENRGIIAQLGEHLPYKQGVTGSSPVNPTICGLVVQLVRMPACHAGGRGFEPLPGRQTKLYDIKLYNNFCYGTISIIKTKMSYN